MTMTEENKPAYESSVISETDPSVCLNLIYTFSFIYFLWCSIPCVYSSALPVYAIFCLIYILTCDFSLCLMYNFGNPFRLP